MVSGCRHVGEVVLGLSLRGLESIGIKLCFYMKFSEFSMDFEGFGKAKE